VSKRFRKASFLVEVSLTNNQRDSFVGRFDNSVFALTKFIRCRPLFQTKVGKFGVTIEIKFIDVMTAFINKKNLKRRTGRLGESTLIFETKVSLLEVLGSFSLSWKKVPCQM